MRFIILALFAAIAFAEEKPAPQPMEVQRIMAEYEKTVADAYKLYEIDAAKVAKASIESLDRAKLEYLRKEDLDGANIIASTMKRLRNRELLSEIESKIVRHTPSLFLDISKNPQNVQSPIATDDLAQKSSGNSNNNATSSARDVLLVKESMEKLLIGRWGRAHIGIWEFNASGEGVHYYYVDKYTFLWRYNSNNTFDISLKGPEPLRKLTLVDDNNINIQFGDNIQKYARTPIGTKENLNIDGDWETSTHYVFSFSNGKIKNRGFDSTTWGEPVSYTVNAQNRVTIIWPPGWRDDIVMTDSYNADAVFNGGKGKMTKIIDENTPQYILGAANAGPFASSIGNGLAVAITFDQMPLTAWTRIGHKTCKIIGSPVLVEGVRGKAMKIDSSTHLEFDVAESLPIYSSPRTMAFWFMGTSGSSGAMVEWGNTVRSQRWFSLCFNSGSIRFGCHDPDLPDSKPVLAQGGWHHLAYVSDGETIQGYIDGKSFAKMKAIPFTAKSNLFIGRSCNYSWINGEKLSGGIIDDVFIWNRPLSAGEIEALANQRQGRDIEDKNQQDAPSAANATPLIQGVSVEFQRFIGVPLFGENKANLEQFYWGILNPDGTSSCLLDINGFDAKPPVKMISGTWLNDQAKKCIIITMPGRSMLKLINPTGNNIFKPGGGSLKIKPIDPIIGKWRREDGNDYEFNSDGTGSFGAGRTPITWKAKEGKRFGYEIFYVSQKAIALNVYIFPNESICFLGSGKQLKLERIVTK